MAHTLKIEKALYGVFVQPGRPNCVDVSVRLKPGERVSVTNDEFGGDPASMRHKALEVVYVLDGKERRDVVKENASYTLPVGAQLKSAWYGVIDPAWKPSGSQTTDITAALAACVADADGNVLGSTRLQATDDYPDTMARTAAAVQAMLAEMRLPMAGIAAALPVCASEIMFTSVRWIVVDSMLEPLVTVGTPAEE